MIPGVNGFDPAGPDNIYQGIDRGAGGDSGTVVVVSEGCFLVPETPRLIAYYHIKQALQDGYLIIPNLHELIQGESKCQKK